MTALRLVQFTDLHLYGRDDGRLRGIAVLPALQATVRAALSRCAPWDALLLTGDLVQDDPAGYQRVRELFGDSPVPVLCLPGNHDVPGAMGDALAAAPFQVGGHALLGDWLVVMLDSTIPGEAGGRLAASELERLDATLASHAGRPALVCLHHHPLPMASRWLDSVGLANGEELFGVLDRHRHVRAVLWGHVHQAWDGDRNGVRLLATPSTCAQFKPRSAGFAIDTRPPAYRWLELHADGTVESAVEWVDVAREIALGSATRDAPPAARVARG